MGVIRSHFIESENDLIADALNDKCAVVFVVDTSDPDDGRGLVMRLPIVRELKDRYEVSHPDSFENLDKMLVAVLLAAIQRGDDFIPFNAMVQRAHEAYAKLSENAA